MKAGCTKSMLVDLLPLGLKPPAQYLEALRAGVMSRFLADFHELRQDFSPTEPEASTTFECSLKAGTMHL